MIIILLAIIAVFVVGIFLVMTKTQRQEANAHAKKRRADAISQNPKGYAIAWAIMLAGGLLTFTLMINGVSFWGGTIWIILPLALIATILTSTGGSKKVSLISHQKAAEQAVTPMKVSDPLEAVKQTIRAVYEAGAPRIVKERTPEEYLSEVGRRVSNPQAPVPISRVVLEILRDDSYDDFEVMRAIIKAQRRSILSHITWPAPPQDAGSQSLT